MNEFLPEKLRSLRKKQGLTQMDLALLLGVSDRAVSKWEKGLSSPTSKHIVFLAKVFNVSVEYFFSSGKNKTASTQKEGMESLYKFIF